MVKLANRLKPGRRDWIALACFALVLCPICYLANQGEKRANQSEEGANQGENQAFVAMTPSEHLKAAVTAYITERPDEVRRHVNAIASTPETRKQKIDEIEAAAERVRQRRAAVQEATQRVEERQRSAASELQSDLKNLGYDLTVSQSSKPGEITIASKDFADTDHRVRFLSLLRGRNSPGIEICFAGFQTVRLKDAGFFGFSEVYSLDCSNR